MGQGKSAGTLKTFRMSDYVPIACMDHERLEFAVLRRQKLRLDYREEGGQIVVRMVLPTDVATREGAEWLSYREIGSLEGTESILRLDRIISAQPVT